MKKRNVRCEWDQWRLLLSLHSSIGDLGGRGTVDTVSLIVIVIGFSSQSPYEAQIIDSLVWIYMGLAQLGDSPNVWLYLIRERERGDQFSSGLSHTLSSFNVLIPTLLLTLFHTTAGPKYKTQLTFFGEVKVAKWTIKSWHIWYIFRVSIRL